MPADPARVRSLFLQAADLPTAERPAFVAAVPDADERAELERLLHAHDAPDARLDATAAHLPATEAHSSGDVGQLVADRYKLLERIGEGGMGTVWMAEQRTPVKRLVAVKLIKPGLETRAVLARFEAERQALAVMDHPSIARVLDAGETADGRPFFVMELVRGTTITRFCDDNRLTTRQRLELFVPVCQALQHAHTKGVIHRDIKPGNVLVAIYDGRPVPKVIDFGVAKAAGQTLTDKTLHTGFGAVVGTPEYMSPEQATLDQVDVDTRSDVYALGVLLYELLTGGPPFSHKELAKAGLLEMLRVVREQEPPRPSTKLSTAAGLASLAATRGTDPGRLAGLLRGEVDWIVMKALEKDRNRRYETATGLAADVRRHLDGEPVQAVPPSASYRLRKFARRHRGRLAVAAVLLLALVAGLLGTGWQAVRAEREAVRARSAEAEAEAKRGEAAQKQQEAEDNFQTAELYLSRYSGAIWDIAKKRAKAEVQLKSRNIDLALLELKSDERVGILRLTAMHASDPKQFSLTMPNFGKGGSTRNTLPLSSIEGYDDLNSFTTAVIMATTQDYAPLLPPLTRDALGFEVSRLSPDGLSLLTLSSDGVTRLWDLRTATLKAILRENDEFVLAVGFSPDGNNLFTSDTDSRIRIWGAANATLRSKTEIPVRRLDFPPGMSRSQQGNVARTADNIFAW